MHRHCSEYTVKAMWKHFCPAFLFALQFNLYVYWPKTLVKQGTNSFQSMPCIHIKLDKNKMDKILMLKVKNYILCVPFSLNLLSSYRALTPIFVFRYCLHQLLVMGSHWATRWSALKARFSRRDPKKKNLHFGYCCSFHNILCIQSGIPRRSCKDTGVCSNLNLVSEILFEWVSPLPSFV